MALLRVPPLTAAPPPSQCSWKADLGGRRLTVSSCFRFGSDPIPMFGSFDVRAFFPNPDREPILKEALKEPVAFVGGMFAGLLRLDLNEEPLKEWVARTVEASGMTVEEISKKDEEEDEEMPQQIEIE